MRRRKGALALHTIPRDDHDQGWQIAGPTWVGGETQRRRDLGDAFDRSRTGLLYVASESVWRQLETKRHEPLHRFDSCAHARHGHAEVVTSSRTHHDVWDYDSGNQPILFDLQLRGARVKALAEASKNGYLYILNRETGQPVHSIRETPVPTETSRPGEQTMAHAADFRTPRQGQPMKP